MIVNPQVFSRPRSTNFAQALDPFSQGLGFSAPRFSQVPAFDFSSFASPTYGSVSNVYGGLGLLDANPTGINQFMQNYGLLSNAPAQNFGTQPNQPAPQPVPNFQPPPLPPVDTSVYQPGGSTDSSGPVANLSNFGPDVGNGGLFGGGLASTVAPSPDGLNPNIPSSVSSTPVPQDVRSAYEAAVKSAQEQRKNGFMGRVVLPGEMGFYRFAEGYNYRLNNPNLQPLTSLGNDGFGSLTQGPLDFLDGSNIAQPTLGGNVGGDNLMGVLPNGGVIAGQPGPGFGLADEGGPIDPFRNPYSMLGFTPLPPGELGFTENMMDPPFEAYMGGSKYFDESTGLYTGPESYLNQKALYKFADGGLITGQPGAGFGMPDGNGPGGVTLRPTPGATPTAQGFI